MFYNKVSEYDEGYTKKDSVDISSFQFIGKKFIDENLQILQISVSRC